MRSSIALIVYLFWRRKRKTAWNLGVMYKQPSWLSMMRLVTLRKTFTEKHAVFRGEEQVFVVFFVVVTATDCDNSPSSVSIQGGEND